MSPGFLHGTEYWFGEIPAVRRGDRVAWRRSSSRPSDEHLYYAPEGHLEWYQQFYVEEGPEERYKPVV